MTAPTLHPVGGVIGGAITAAIAAVMYWMLHPPASRTVKIAKTAAEQAQEIAGDVLVVFTSDIHSEVLMALAARMAKGRRADLVCIYVIEVPYTLPVDAELPKEERAGLELLTAAEEIGRKAGLEIRTRIIRDRQAGPAIIRVAQEENARLIVMGAYREQRYAGAPLAKSIEYVTTHTQTDVLIGVSSSQAESMLSLGPLEPAPGKGEKKW